MTLTTDTNSLLIFLKKLKIDLPKKIANVEELYNDIHSAFQYMKYNEIHIQKFSQKILNVNNILKPSNFSSNFITQEIYDEINNKTIVTTRYLFELLNRKYSIIFNISDITDIDLIDSYLNKIIIWLYIVHLYSSSSCSKKLDIYIFLTDVKKKLPTNNFEEIGKKHINSGYTYCCKPNNEIVIYRKEEWFKVFIHESMHAFGLDFCSFGLEKEIKNILYSHFPLNSNMYLYESYCETWATILNLLINIYLKNPNINYLKFEKTYNNYVTNEIKFSLFQTTKILNFMDIKYKDLYSKKSSSSIRRDYMYKENTELFSYFIVKTILLYNHNLFIKWCREHNFSLINFNKTHKNIFDFCDFIINKYKKINIVNNFKNIEELLINKSSNINNKTLQTSKMSLYDFN